MRFLILIPLLFLGACAAKQKTDPYAAACGPAQGYFFAPGETVPEGIGRDYLENVPLKALECRAGEGDFYAQYNLGRLYLQGKRVDLDYQKAAELFYLAGKPTDYEQKRIQSNIGGTAFLGTNARAERTLGFPPAQYALGLMFWSGLHTRKDIDQALHWIEMAAGLGNPEAQKFLNEIGAE